MTNPKQAGLTLAEEISLTGTGLHTGEEVKVALRPREEAGVVFVREDLPGRPSVRASVSNLVLELRRTVLREQGVEVHTPEHLLAVLYGMSVTGVEVGLWGREVPGFDGSGRVWVERIKAGGTVAGKPLSRTLTLSESVCESSSRGALVAVPHGGGGLLVDYILDHDNPAIPVQTVSFRVDPQLFPVEIAPARTFVLEEEVEVLKAAGLGRGADKSNTLILTSDGKHGQDLRFQDEFARHKVLDLLGDLSLLEARLSARVVGIRSGHRLNAGLVRRLNSLYR